MAWMRIEPYEIVQIRSGKRWTPPYMREQTTSEGAEVQAWNTYGIKKDGEPSYAKGHGNVTHLLMPEAKWGDIDAWTRYDAVREAQADVIRAEIARLDDARRVQMAALLALYLQKKETA